jgi:cholesterol transport system auxiliary component
MIKNIFLVMSLFFIAGCGIKDVQMHLQNYRLENILHVKPEGLTDTRVLKVQKIEGDSAVMSRSILYKKEGALLPYKYSRWNEVPSNMLQQIIIEHLEKKKVFKATIPNVSMASNDLFLESELGNFEQVYEKESSYVYVKLRFRLVQKSDARVLGSTSIEKKVIVPLDTTKGVIDGFNLATSEVVEELSIWIKGLL